MGRAPAAGEIEPLRVCLLARPRPPQASVLSLRSATLPNVDPMSRFAALQRCHSAASLGDSLVFFGGGRSDTLSNGVSHFNPASGIWRAAPDVVAGRAPSPRQNAQAGFFPGSGLLIVFGGWQLGPFGGDRNLGDTNVLDFDETLPSGRARAEEAPAEGGDSVEEGEEESQSGSDTEGHMGIGGGLPPGLNIVGTHPIYGPLVDMGSHGLVPLMMLMQMQGDEGAGSPGSGSGGEEEDHSEDDPQLS
jgi:hypothetical protein